MLGFSYQVAYADSGDDGRNVSQPKHTADDATESNTLEPTEHQDNEYTDQPKTSVDNESDAYPDNSKQAQNDAQTREFTFAEGKGPCFIMWQDVNSRKMLYVDGFSDSTPLQFQVSVNSEYESYLRVRATVDCEVDQYGLVQDQKHRIYFFYSPDDIALNMRKDGLMFDILGPDEFLLPPPLKQNTKSSTAFEKGYLMACRMVLRKPPHIVALHHQAKLRGVGVEVQQKLISLSKAKSIFIVMKKNNSIVYEKDRLVRAFWNQSVRGTFLRARYQVNKNKEEPVIQFNMRINRETLLETGPIFRVKVKDAFRTLDEYLLTMATAVQREWDARREIAVQMKKQPCTIVLVADQKTRKREDGLLRRYFAFVKLDSAEDPVRHLLGPGDRVNLADEIQDFEFDEDPETAGVNEELVQVEISKKFTGKSKSKGKGKMQGVVLGLPYFARFFDLCLAMNLDERTHVPNFFKPAISDPRNLEESSGSTCFLDPIDSDRPSRKLFKALARFQKLQEKFTDITKVLLGNDMSTSRETNPYQDLPQKAIGAIGSLYPDQRLVFEDASKVNNRLQVLIGPPGTGKTHTLAHMALANAFAGKVTVVATVTNHACNVATNLIKRVFYEHHADFLFCRYEALSLALKRFKTMLSKHKPATAKNTPAAAAPPLDEDDNRSDMIYDDLALELLIDQMRSEDDSYAKDRRITREVAPYILSRMMTDRLHGGKDVELSHLFREFQTGFPNDEEGNARSKQFQDAIKQMASDIPLSCSVIITTLGNCDDLGSIKGFRPATVLVDEAGVCTEPDLIMAIANFPEAEAFVLCGDPKQNPPTVVSSARSLVYHNQLTINNFETKHEDGVVKTGQPTAPEAPQNEFSEQLKTSPLVRLVERLQWPSIMLTHQHRAVPGIRQIWGKLYDNRIQDTPGTEVTSRQNAMKFQTLMKEKYGLDNCSYVVMDVRGSVNKKSGTSTYNPAFIDVALGCLENLFTANFPAADICIITPYQAERRAFINVFTHMSKTLKAEGAWVEQLQFVDAVTIDSLQGDERSIVIVDLVAAAGVKHRFVEDGRRLNVAISRARDGMIIIGDGMGASTQPQELLQLVRSGKTAINRGNLYTGIFACALSDGFLIPVEANAYPGKQWWAEYEAPPEPVEGGDSKSWAAATDGRGWTSTEANGARDQLEGEQPSAWGAAADFTVGIGKNVDTNKGEKFVTGPDKGAMFVPEEQGDEYNPFDPFTKMEFEDHVGPIRGGGN